MTKLGIGVQGRTMTMAPRIVEDEVFDRAIGMMRKLRLHPAAR